MRALEAVVDVNDRRSIFAASIMSGGGAMCFLLFPMIIGGAMERLSLDGEKASYLFSAYMLGFTCITISAAAWVRRVNWKVIATSAYLTLSAGLAFVATLPSYNLLLVGFFASGCGGGMLYGLALCMVGDTDEPDRYFGVKLVGEQWVGGALLWLLPITTMEVWGFAGLCFGAAGTALLLALTCVWVPAQGTKGIAPKRLSTKTSLLGGRNLLLIWLGLFALMTSFGGQTAVWGFVERIADAQGIATEEIGRGLSLAVLGGGLGGLTAALLGDRFGRGLPLIVSLLVLAGVCIIYNTEFGAWTFTAASFMFSYIFNLSLAYQLGIVASSDHAGHFTVLMSSALSLGAAWGAALGGWLLSNYSAFTMLTVVGMAIMSGAVCIFLWLLGQMYPAAEQG